MSSDDGLSEYHSNKVQHHLQSSPKKPSTHHQQLSIHQEVPTALSIASASTQTINCNEHNGPVSGGTIKRRKSATISTASPVAYSIHPDDFHHDNANDDEDAQINCQAKSTTNPINSYHYSTCANGTGNSIITNNNSVSPSKYIHHNDSVYLHMASGGNPNCLSGTNRLSIHHPTASDRYDTEITTCCLPPPSPAPNSDRFVLGIPSPSLSGHHHQHHHQQLYQQTPTAADNKFSTIHHRSMSPSSR